ncbi:MAG: helix-hairpin-helix domain-containing protein [Lachnospiraceae bacterium]|nr:helix-hairpin-helix domain-containing protein [Lachnospiraceae bacterium]
MKKGIKGALLTAAALLSALMLTGCGDPGEMTLSQLETADGALEAESGPENDGDLLSQDSGNRSSDISDTAAGVSADETIVVYICGCVQSPGVYELPAGSRVCDGLEAAGGFSDNADEKRINLAGVLSDGDMVFFPEVGEALAEGASDYIPDSEAGSTSGAPININTAGEQALCSLPGIGSSKAQAIISYREEHGSFKDIKEIMNVNGIGENLFAQIKDLICV